MARRVSSIAARLVHPWAKPRTLSPTIQPASKSGCRRKPGSPPEARPTSVRPSLPAMVSTWTVRLSAVAQSAKQFAPDARCGGHSPPRLIESRGHDTSSTLRKSRKPVPTPGRPHALAPATTKLGGIHREVIESLLQAARQNEGQSGTAATGRLREHPASSSTRAELQKTEDRTQPPNGMRLSCGATLEGSQTQFYHRRRAPAASGAC